MQVTTIGLDIAKNVFQVHGIDAEEKVVIRKQLRRNKVMAFFKALPPCLIGMEACATAHYWARELTKLGHKVRLMPPKDVKAYLKESRPRELHPRPLAELDVRLSLHPAPIRQTRRPDLDANVRTVSAACWQWPRSFGWLVFYAPHSACTFASPMQPKWRLHTATVDTELSEYIAHSTQSTPVEED